MNMSVPYLRILLACYRMAIWRYSHRGKGTFTVRKKFTGRSMTTIDLHHLGIWINFSLTHFLSRRLDPLRAHDCYLPDSNPPMSMS